MNNKLLSIIIPVYNGEKYIDDCLKSIYNIEDKYINKFEVIIIDDGSLDNTKTIYLKYQQKYDNIKIIINKKNYGVSYSRNLGINVSIAKFITFVDADDYLKNNWEHIFNYCEKYENNDIIYISKSFNKNFEQNISKGRILSYILTCNDEKILIQGPYSKLYNRQFLISNNIKFKEDLINGEDIIFNIDSLLKSKKYLLIRNAYYIHRINQLSTTHNLNNNIVDSEINFNKYIYELISKFNIDKKNYFIDYAFLISIRTFLYRIAYLEKYSDAKKIYKNIRKNPFFDKKIKNFKPKEKNKGFIFIYLFKHEKFYILYKFFKYRISKEKKEYIEEL